jgi:amidophosphoribosyltransferase
MGVLVGCGVFGVALKREGQLDSFAAVGMTSITHRGEESHGFAALEQRRTAFLGLKDGIKIRRGMGPAMMSSEIFEKPIYGRFGTGQTRYGTSAGNGFEHAQPFGYKVNGTEFAISHNGNFPNIMEIARDLGIGRDKANNSSDTKIAGMLIAETMRRDPNLGIEEAIGKALKDVAGSYSMVVLFSSGNRKGLLAVRDGYGKMPLWIGGNDAGWFVSSETVTFEPAKLNAPDYRRIIPGEMVVLDGNRVDSGIIFKATAGHCSFQASYKERIDSYFESPVSDGNGRSIYEIREEIGRIIGRRYLPGGSKENLIVIGVPDSGTLIAVGYHDETGVPFKLGLRRDPYVGHRVYMMPSEEDRERMTKAKLDPVRAVVEGKRVLLMDDSVVRGTTAKRQAEKLRAAGALEVYLALGHPPIISGCPYGNDFYTEELMAKGGDVARKLGFDDVFYISREDHASAIGMPVKSLCYECTTGLYSQPVELLPRSERRN